MGMITRILRSTPRTLGAGLRPFKIVPDDFVEPLLPAVKGRSPRPLDEGDACARVADKIKPIYRFAGLGRNTMVNGFGLFRRNEIDTNTDFTK